MAVPPPAVPAPPGEDWPPADAASGVADPKVADLLRRHWALTLELAPQTATELGIHRFDDRLEDNTPSGLARQRAVWYGFRSEARLQLARKDLSATDRTSLVLLVEALDAALSEEVCAFEEWSLSASQNPLTRWSYLPTAQKVGSLESGRALTARYAQIALHVDREITQLRRGLARGLVSNAESTRRVMAMFEKQLAEPIERWPLLAPLDVPHPDWPAAELQRYRERLRQLTEIQIRPAFERYLRFLGTEVLPRAHGDDTPGLVHLPNGAACYRTRILAYTTLERDPRELHQIGIRQIERLDAELAALSKRAIGSGNLADALRRLREDRSLYFTSAEEIVAAAEQTLERARRALPRAFTLLPRASCVVARVPDYEAAFTWAAYYRHPTPDGSKPGEYFVNVYRPETRPRFEAAVLAFHESIPGHHLQIALAQELGDLPAFRKHLGTTAFVEGWALYAERLADELGLYESDLDRVGLLSFDAWRASRLVVDTGLHAFGWSRQQAIDFMLAHTALSPENIDNEVDRYIVWPGQALAYKSGQIEILALRDLAREKLGSRFDLRAFHAAVLAGGALSLPLLREHVVTYIERASRGG
jgi:uncharacterized protein (DUF885 family)